MNEVSLFEINKLISKLDLKVGAWGQLSSIGASGLSKAYRPPIGGLALYAASSHLVSWIASGNWTVLQIDNSTFPAEDEKEVFERLMLPPGTRWNAENQRSFIFRTNVEAGKPQHETSIMLVIFFALMFQWHVHFTSERASSGQRLALQDGTVYFFGDENALAAAEALVRIIGKSTQHLV